MNTEHISLRQSMQTDPEKNDNKNREFERFTVAYNAGYCCATEEMLLPCRIVDISQGGSRIELFAKHALTAGSTIELYIEIPGLSRRVVALFRCLWTRPAEDAENDGGSLIGGCFIDLNPEDRKILLSHAHARAA